MTEFSGGRSVEGEADHLDRMQPVRLADRTPLVVGLLMDLTDPRAGLGLHLEVLAAGVVPAEPRC